MTAILRPPYREDQGTVSRWAEETFGAIDGTRADSLPRLVEACSKLFAAAKKMVYRTPSGDAPGGNLRVAVRALEEMAELVEKLVSNDGDPLARPEIADVFIILMRLADRLGGDVLADVDAKMTINRARTWKPDGTGHGYHVREPAPEDLPWGGDPAWGGKPK